MDWTKIRKEYLVALLLIVFAVQVISSSRQKSATWDETHYLGVGLHLLEETGSKVPSASLHPPLSYYVNSLPLVFCDVDRSCMETGEPGDIIAGVGRGRCLLENSRPSGDALLFLARLPTLLVGLLLGFFVFRWSSLLFGTWAGLFSLLLYSMSPNILAHTRLITPDVYLTVFGFVAAYSFWRMMKDGSARSAVLCGLCLGLALMSKYSGLVWVPLLIFLGAAGGKVSSGEGLSPRRTIFLVGTVVLPLALGVLALGYGFRLNHYIQGVFVQQEIVGQGFPAFLMGESSRFGGWWYYYLAAFFLKVPIPLILLFVFTALAVRGEEGADRFSLICLATPVAVFLVALSLLTKVNIGLRYVLPLFPFLMVLAGSLIPFVRRRTLLPRLVVGALAVWLVFESLSIHPHYLAYFNQLGGGPRNGYRLLVDSNLDWGQDLKGLKSYMDRKGMETIRLSYFGSADPAQYGIRYAPLPSLMPLRGRATNVLRKGEIIAVSATLLYPLYVDLGELGDYLRTTPPDDQIGYSLLIYRLEKDLRVGR